MYQNQLVNVQQVARILSASVSGVWAKASASPKPGEPAFPKPFKLSAKQTRWKLSELYSYIDLKAATQH
jgi:prophage regulatory protein